MKLYLVELSVGSINTIIYIINTCLVPTNVKITIFQKANNDFFCFNLFIQGTIIQNRYWK
jgi:hypothetical protein